jgi:nucleoside-diphosphate-sugar epimerase
MKEKPVLAVIGAGGFIGSRIVESFHLRRIADVVPVVRRASALASASRFGIKGRVADALDRPSLRLALAGAEVVVHAVAGDPRTITRGVGPAVRAAAEAGCRRFIYLSTAAVHGQAPEPGTDEASPLSNRQPIAYNNAKVIAEKTLFEEASRRRIEAIALRPGIVFGPRSQWTGGLADRLLSGSAYLVDGGAGICNSTYIDNLLHAIELSMKDNSPAGEAFLVCDLETVTWSEFVGPIAGALGLCSGDIRSLPPNYASLSWSEGLDRLRTAPLTQKLLRRLPASINAGLTAAYWSWHGIPESPDTPPRIADLETTLLHTCRTKLPSTKARQRLGYVPPVSFAEGVRRSIAWLAFAGYPVRTIGTDTR